MRPKKDKSPWLLTLGLTVYYGIDMWGIRNARTNVALV